MDTHRNYGLIIRHLRKRAGLSIQTFAKKMERSVGWVSGIENGLKQYRLTERDFNLAVKILNGDAHRSMFKIWVAKENNDKKIDRTFDGVVLKHVRIKKAISLQRAAILLALSISYISKLENGEKPVSLEMRNRILAAYGYSPSSFKNFHADPVRSKAVSKLHKLKVLLKSMSDQQIDAVFQFSENLLKTNQ